MKLKILSPLLFTGKLEETIEFYVQKLGFYCKAVDHQTGWTSLRRDNIEIMFSLPNEHIPFEKAGCTGSFYIYTDEVDQLWDEIRNEVSVCYEIDNFDYGMREFAIYDNNGYILQFGQKIDRTN